MNEIHDRQCPVGEYYTDFMFTPAPCVAAAPLHQLAGRAFVQAIEALHSPLSKNSFDFDGIELESCADLPSVWYDEPSPDHSRPGYAVTGLSALFLFHGIGDRAPCVPSFTHVEEGHYVHDILWGMPVLRPSMAIADLHAIGDLRKDSGVDEKLIAELIDETLRARKATEFELAHDIEQATNYAHNGYAELQRYRSMVGVDLPVPAGRMEHSGNCCPGSATRRRQCPRVSGVQIDVY